MSGSTSVRGRLYWADIGFGRKPWLVVSNNHRNRALGDCLAVRVTTTKKEPRPTVVPLGQADPLAGWVLCDEITLLYDEDLVEDAGALSLATMTSVAAGLKTALAL